MLLLTGEVLPRLVGLPEVHGSLQNPEVRPRRVGKFDQHVCHVEELQRYRRRRNADEKHFDLVWTVDGETAGLTLKQEKQEKTNDKTKRREKTALFTASWTASASVLCDVTNLTRHQAKTASLYRGSSVPSFMNHHQNH